MPRPVEVFTAEKLGRKSLNRYVSLEGSIEAMRAYRPLDLTAEAWKKANPDRSHQEWAKEAREFLRAGLHYDMPPVKMAFHADVGQSRRVASIDEADARSGSR